MGRLSLEIGIKNAYLDQAEGNLAPGKGNFMTRRICLGVISVVVFFTFLPPAWAQLDISGWWSVKGTYLQGDFVTGDWVTLQARGKKVSYLYLFQETATSGTGQFVIWDDASQNYLLETYTLFFKNNIVVLYIPTVFDSGDNPAAATIILRALGSASTITTMNGYYTLYDMENEATPDQFVRMGPVMANRVLVSQVPNAVKELVTP